MKHIRGSGSGGKGGGGHTPTEADDTLQSIQQVRVLDLLCEGPIEGMDSGSTDQEKDIYFDGVPVKDSNGVSRFDSYSIITRNGTQDQAYIADLEGISSNNEVNQVITKTGSPGPKEVGPIGDGTNSTSIDRVRINITFDSLQLIEADGDIVANEVELEIKVKYNGGSYVSVKTDKITGKSSAEYKRAYLLTLTPWNTETGGSSNWPVYIKVFRNTDDDSSAKNYNTFRFANYQTITDEKLRYPNSALCFMKFDARSFNRIPERRFKIRGLKVNIPHNGTVDTTTHIGRVTYSGLFTGSVNNLQWTNDPSWCLYDLLTNTRFGAAIPASSLDVFDFYEISKHCNELVSDGKGGEEPRFSCNVIINSKAELFNVINTMTSIFRGMAYFGAGTLVALQDKAETAKYLLSNSNVVDGVFEYTGTSQKARHTVVSVAYQDYDSLGETKIEYVEDAGAIEKYGIIPKDVHAIGCYSQGQARRLGKWMILSEQNLTQTISFSVSIESGILLRPGMVIDVADAMKAGKRRSGRVSSATTQSITIDSSSGFADSGTIMGQTPTISVLMPTGLVETFAVSAIDNKVITIAGTFSEAPNSQSVWLFQTEELESQQFRVVLVGEAEDGVYGVTALEYNSTIYDAVEDDLKVEQRAISNLTEPPDPVSLYYPTQDDPSEYLYQQGQNIFVGFQLSWSPADTGGNATSFLVSYRLAEQKAGVTPTSYKAFGEWITQNIVGQTLDIKPIKAGRLEVKVQPINYVGIAGNAVSEIFVVEGKTTKPGNVTNLSFEATSENSGRLRWTQSNDLDVKVGGKVRIRFSNDTTATATWSNSTDWIDAKSGVATEAIVPKAVGTIFARFADSSTPANLSPTAAKVVIGDTQKEQPLTFTHYGSGNGNPIRKETSFLGTKTNCEVDGSVLKISGSAGSVQTSATYNFGPDNSNVDNYDFGGLTDTNDADWSFDFARHIVSRGSNVGDLIDSWPDVNAREDWDGDIADRVNAQIQVRTTKNYPHGGGITPTWTEWIPLSVGTFSGRAFQVKTIMTSEDNNQTILIDQLGIVASMGKRIEQSTSVIGSGTSDSGYNVTFANSFYGGNGLWHAGSTNTTFKPTISIIPENMATGDFFNVSNVSATGFTVRFQKADGSTVSRNFYWSASGYGIKS